MKFKNISRIALSSLLALGLIAVSPVSFSQDGMPASLVKAQKLPDIRLGMTKSEVEHVLGKPANTPKWLSGGSTWGYSTDIGYSTRYDVDFGADGKVTRAGLYQVYSTGNT
ncbi:outer membrane protein assembly factor BamE [Uliginosibacterium sp. 31-16]|uniref:outer membrane protein assembly factor BamE domain-containing protein n=1 Tax=Uliginosibacterium sp. 31-16 TaxID=3068315 RepID=UPI00273D5715|nr:outer membrane protein assembly factor BamE [Uliginosibacterium sp. 31-16]MDP5239492.1 outer membrane protein assembly factor BamE [Uliginosibacterium sp. 31-16]